jgi:hypothetical protein
MYFASSYTFSLYPEELEVRSLHRTDAYNLVDPWTHYLCTHSRQDSTADHLLLTLLPSIY